MKSSSDIIHPHVTYGQLRGIAEQLGVNVWSQELPEGVAGCYDDEYHAIVIDRNMTYRRKRCALVHELIHWLHGDVACQWTIDTRIEMRTRRETAMALVALEEYAQAENVYDGDIRLIAAELDVTRQVAEDYRGMVLAPLRDECMAL
ncbi:MAG: ImmA/IrrE family metallo-endopeptidase [Bifidobacterium mongoliense]|jgi:Zn-dependent peptidase ImmA (M78 family)|uniref:ImmA/IrrE family metallo-endopeptidase n=1 Tax=Bifidobacterium mongoliense TaxID=518643 RepID=UPI002F360E0D